MHSRLLARPLSLGVAAACGLGSTAARNDGSTAQQVQDLEKRLGHLEAQLLSQSKGSIVSIGEALIDFLPRPLLGETGYQPRCGGAPFNVCLTTARLGAPTLFLSNVSTDLFGDKICRELSENGVSLELVQRVSQPSTLAFVDLAGEEPQYAFFFENAADRSLTTGSLPKLPSTVDALHLSFGAITLEAPVAKVFDTLLGQVKDLVFTSFDPNIRSMMISDPVAYGKLLEGFVGKFDLIKVSDADLEYLYGEGRNLDDIAKDWLARGAKLVLVTKGSQGTTAFRPGSSFSVAVDPVKVVDAVGAGDSYMGAFLVSLQEKGALAKGALEKLSDEEVRDSMDFAAKVAAITCTRAGADPPTVKEVDEVYTTRVASL